MPLRSVKARGDEQVHAIGRQHKLVKPGILIVTALSSSKAICLRSLSYSVTSESRSPSTRSTVIRTTSPAWPTKTYSSLHLVGDQPVDRRSIDDLKRLSVSQSWPPAQFQRESAFRAPYLLAAAPCKRCSRCRASRVSATIRAPRSPPLLSSSASGALWAGIEHAHKGVKRSILPLHRHRDDIAAFRLKSENSALAPRR